MLALVMADFKQDRQPSESVSEKADVSETLGSASTMAEQRPLASAVLEAGATLGRYVVLEMLGQGGMGVVYGAYDPELDRKVALKLLRADVGGSEPSTQGRHRLLREAQALARLSHPNVITVHDVGTVDDQVFVAMEFIDGQSLGDWSLGEKRSLKQILPVFIAAGRGLAAAHKAELVHRDFKPENVLIDKEQRVRVLDFGLARPTSSTGETHRDQSLRSDSSALSVSVTKTGSVVGTPAYMAPEQFLGLTADARSDQFSFCVALYEALYGTRPFAGDNLADLAKAVIRGRVREAPAGSQVSPSLRKLVLRGLQVSADERFPSMDALLEELSRDPARTKKRVGLAVGLALFGALGVYGAKSLVAAQDELCRHADDKLVGVWDDETRSQIRAAFITSGRPYAGDTFSRVASALDQRTQNWVGMYTETCEATHVRGEQSEALLDLRMQCLDGHMRDLGATTRLFASAADGEIVDTAIQGVVQLASLDRCADVQALQAEVPPPEDPALRTKVDALRMELDSVNALNRAGKYRAGLETIHPIFETSAALGYLPLQADLLSTRASLESSLGDAEAAEMTLRELLETAASVQSHRQVAESWIGLLSVVGHKQARHDEVISWIPFARAAVTQAGNEAMQRSRFLRNAGMLLNAAGKYDEAKPPLEEALLLRTKHKGETHISVAAVLGSLASLARSEGDYKKAKEYAERALKITEGALGLDHPEVATSLNNLAILEHRLGESRLARAYHERALGIREAALGPEHRLVAASLNNLGNISFGEGNYEAAEQEYRRSLKIREKVLGPDHPLVASPTNNLGSVLQALGRNDEAIAMYKKAYAIREKSLGAEHPRTASPLQNLGFAYEAKKDYANARAYFQQAMEVYEKALGPEHARIGALLTNLGSVSLAERNYSDAKQLFEKALRIAESSLGPDHAEVGDALNALGETYLEMGQVAKARPMLERALRIRTQDVGSGTYLAQTRFALARAKWSIPLERTDALKMARLAAEAYQETGEGAASQLAEVESWLAKHQPQTKKSSR